MDQSVDGIRGDMTSKILGALKEARMKIEEMSVRNLKQDQDRFETMLKEVSTLQSELMTHELTKLKFYHGVGDQRKEFILNLQLPKIELEESLIEEDEEGTRQNPFFNFDDDEQPELTL